MASARSGGWVDQDSRTQEGLALLTGRRPDARGYGDPAVKFAAFLRATNVGGHQTLKPSAVAKNLSGLGTVSIGAAGTFVFLRAAGGAEVRAAIRSSLPFEPEMAVCPGAKVVALANSRPFGREPPRGGERRFVTVLTARPSEKPNLPLDRPEGSAWQLRVLRAEGPFVLSLRRPHQPGKFYPNDAVEKAFGVPATTRAWSTFEAVCRALEEG